MITKTVSAGSSPLLDRYGERQLAAARETLSEFVLDLAAQTSGEVGFGFVAQTEAPNTYPALRRAFAKSSASGSPLPVSDANSESAPYVTPEVNFALRYVHDVNHVRRRLSFSLPDELELALFHLGQLERVGFGPDSPVWQLLHADLLGSVYVMSIARRFPGDQLRFAAGCLGAGFDQAVLDEVRREPGRGRE